MKPEALLGGLTVILVSVGLFGCRQKPDDPAPSWELGGSSTQPTTSGHSRGTSASVSAATSTAPEPDEAAPPSVVVAVIGGWSQGASGPDRSARLVVAAWKDGRMIWSDNPVQGGPPYRRGRTQSGSITNLLGELERKGLFDPGRPVWASWGPDAAYTIVGVQDGLRRLRMESWHELFEANGKLVATAHGVTALNGREINQVLAQQPAEYRDARNLWKYIRDTLRAAIPAESAPVQDPDTSKWNLDDFGK